MGGYVKPHSVMLLISLILLILLVLLCFLCCVEETQRRENTGEQLGAVETVVTVETV